MSFTSVLERLDRMDARIARVEARLGLALEPTPADERPAQPDDASPAEPKGLRESRLSSASAIASAPALAAPPVAPLDTAAVAAALRAKSARSTPPLSAAPSSPPTPPDSSSSAAPSASVRSEDPNAPLEPPERRNISWRRREGAEAPARRDLERFVGVSILGRVGVSALLLAAAYFAQWTYQRIGPEMRVASIYALSALLVGAGFALRARVSRTYLGILWGGGVAAAYMAGFVARVHYGLVGPVTATAMLAGACALGQALAARDRMQALAVLAIAGAAAAPVLVGSPEDARTSLLVYLLVVHGWGAFVERRWGWGAARVVALLATGLVALLWLLAHGRADVSTYMHVHLYLLGWTAPEWLAALRGETVERERAIGVPLLLAFAEAAAYLIAVIAGSEAVRRGFAVSTAALWGTLAVAARLRQGGAGPLVKGFARIAGALLVLGGLTLLDSRGFPSLLRERFALAGVASAGLVALSGRRLLGVGEGAATLSAVLGLAVVATMRGATPDVGSALALVVPAALFLSGSAPGWRVSGVLVASAAPFLATLQSRGAGWLAAAYGGSAAIALLSHLRAARRGDAACALAATTVLVALAFGWLVSAGAGPFLSVPAPIANAGSVAAALVVGALAAVAARSVSERQGADPRGLALGAGASLLLAAIWREVHDVTSRMSPADLGALVETATLAVYGGALGALGAFARDRLRRGLLVGALIVGALAALHTLSSVLDGGGALTAAAQMLLVAAPAAWCAARRDVREPEIRAAAVALLFAAVTAWIAARGCGRFDGVALVANGRLLAGAGLVAALVVARRATLRAGPAPLGAAVAIVAALFSFLVGLAEVLDAAGAVHQGPWRRVLVSVYATLHAGAVLAIGFRARDARLRWLAIVGFASVIVKVALFDLESVPTELRILVTACLGAVLLAAAYAYARRSADASRLVLAPAAGPASRAGPPPFE